jgi:cytochrome P450
MVGSCPLKSGGHYPPPSNQNQHRGVHHKGGQTGRLQTTRLYPAFTYIGREAKTDTQIGDYAIKQGTSLGFVAWTIHRDPRWWPEPEKFIPERHTREEMKLRPRCAIVSFGYGQRRCLGERVGRMEGTLMLAMAHQKYVFDLKDGKMPKPKVRMSIHPEGGLEVIAKPRVVP